jgi:hypothetical protein
MLTNKNIFFFNNGQGSSNAASQYYYGVDALSFTNNYSVASADSINGISGSGTFHVQALIRVDTQTVPSAVRPFLSLGGFSNGRFNGWKFRTTSTNSSLSFGSYSTIGALTEAPAYTVSSSVVGSILHICGVHDGTSVRFYVNGQEIGTGTAISGYSFPTSENFGIGLDNNTAGSILTGEITVFGVAGGNTVPTADEIYQAYVSSVRQADIVSIPAKTEHLWSVKQSQNGSAPSPLRDQIGTGNLTRNGTPILAVAPPDSMTVYGLDDLNDSNYYWSAVSGAIDGITGSGNFWVTCMFSVDSQAVTSQNRYMLNHGIANTSGWYMRTLGQNGTLSFAIHDNNAVARTAPSYTIQAADVNKVIVATGYHSVTGVHLNVNGADVGSNTITNGYRESNSSMFIGRYLGSTVSLSGAVKVYGVCGGSGSFPTSEELVAQYEAIKAAGDIVGIPGKTHHLYSIKTDAVNSGSVPGIISDQVGTSSLSKVGSPSLVVDYGPNIRSS